jgi:hypothetical protein
MPFRSMDLIVLVELRKDMLRRRHDDTETESLERSSSLFLTVLSS